MDENQCRQVQNLQNTTVKAQESAAADTITQPMCFSKALSAEVLIKLYCVFRIGTIRKSVQVVNEKQDISLLWPSTIYSILISLPLY